jgi:glycosyltransferase involved in cell wall biosynthesis
VTGARRKLLVLIDALRPGGAERAAVSLAMNMPHDRYEVTLCATRRHDGSLADELAGSGVEYVTLNRSGRFDLLPLWRLFRLLRRERFDVLHAHKFGSNLWGSVIGRLARVPAVIAHEHTWSYQGNTLRRILDGRVIGRLADVFVAVSTRDQERMTSVEGVPPAKTAFVPNAFVPSESASDGDLRDELGLSPDTPVVGTLSVLRAQKAVDVLLDAFALLLDRVPDAQLVIGGYGPMTEEWKAYANSLGIGDRVHWLGMRRDVPVVLRGFDVAAMSSDFEGMPIFAFECMAERVPLVATDVGGLRDIFVPGESALLVPPRSPSEMADALADLLGNADRRRILAEAAHARLAAFSMDRAVERIAALYESVLNGERGRRRRARPRRQLLSD